MTRTSTSQTPTTMFARLVALLALSATITPFAAAHSWIEEYQVISSNSSFVGPRGFSRGYVGRDEPTFTGLSDEWMLPSLDARNADGTVRTRINGSDLLCNPAQRVSNYTSTYPMLQVQAGDWVAMKYLENGHVSLPWNITGKPPGSGTVYVFGTTQPVDDEKIVNVMKWNAEGTSGDKRGFLMTAQNFDDGRCHQLNCGNISTQRQMLEPNHVAGQPTSTVESWCETDLKIPENTTAGTLTTYWVWQWPTLPNMDCNTPDGKDEYYTTCADFDVVASSDVDSKVLDAPFSAPVGANPQSVAVKDYQSRTAILPTPSVLLQENNTLVGSLYINSAFQSSCTAQNSVIVANTLTMWPEVYVPNSCTVISTFGSAAASSAAANSSSAAASYTSQRSVVFSAAFGEAKIALPTVVWNDWAVATGAAAGASAYSSSTPSMTAAPVTSSTSAPASYSSASAPSEIVDILTVTTLVVITDTVTAGKASSTSAASSSMSSSPASSSTTAPNPYGLSTILTVGTSSAAPPARRDHPRNFR